MKNIKNTMIYPFDEGATPLVRYSNLIDGYRFIKLISPIGWGFCGKDASSVDGGLSIGIKVESDFEKGMEYIDTVLFVNPDKEISFDTLVYPKMIMAAKYSKNIITDFNLDEDKIKELNNICKSYGTEFKLLRKKVNKINESSTERIYDTSTPVIFVLGLGERTEKFDIQLKLRENLKDKGYSISQVGTKSYSELFGFHSFPEFMYSGNIMESQKIVLFNYYIKKIEELENPDIILIGIPGGTMPFNNKLTNRFGILAYEVSQSIIPDIAILSIFNDEVDQEFCKLISNSYRYKFGYDIDYFNVANTSVDFTASEVKGILQYVRVDSNFIDNKIRSAGVDAYNILNEKDVNAMAELAVDKLAKYGENQIV